MADQEDLRVPLTLPALARAWLSTSALFLSGMFVPWAGTFLMIFTPQPGLSLAGQRHGGAALGGLVGGVTLTAAIAVGVAPAVAYLMGFALLTFCLSVAMRRSWSIEKAVVTGAGAELGILSLAVLVSGTWDQIVAMLRESLESGGEWMVSTYREAGLPAERVEALAEASPEVIDVVTRLLPGLAIVGVGAVVLANVILLRWRQRARGVAPAFGDLTRWRVPDRGVWILIASGYGMLVPVPEIRWIGANVFIVSAALYLCQGFSILHFLFDRWSVRPWVRTFLIVIVAIEWPLTLGVALLGLFDLWRDFRNLDTPEDSADLGD